jgi:hypothetical protein
MSSAVYTNSGFSTKSDLALNADFGQGPLRSTTEILCLAGFNLTDLFLPLKELVQAMARQAAEMDYKD